MNSKVQSLTINERVNPETKKTVHYHQCILEDGQKISIGKMEPGAIKVGDDIEYELVDDGKGGQKAKELKKPFNKGFQKQKSSNAGYALSYAKDLAVARISKDGEIVEIREILYVADLFYNWMQEHE